MSVWFTLSAAPRVPVLPEREAVAALAGDLVSAHVVSLPAYLLTGQIGSSASPLAFSNEMFDYFQERWDALRSELPEPDPPESISGKDFAVDVRYLPDDLGALLAALYAAPIGAEDVAVYFQGLATPPDMDPPGHYTMASGAMLFALRERQTLHGIEETKVDDGSVPEDPPVGIPGDTEPSDAPHPAFLFLQTEEKGGPWMFLPHVPPVLARHWGEDFVMRVQTS
jgi:hypothetical protein